MIVLSDKVGGYSPGCLTVYLFQPLNAIAVHTPLIKMTIWNQGVKVIMCISHIVVSVWFDGMFGAVRVVMLSVYCCQA